MDESQGEQVLPPPRLSARTRKKIGFQEGGRHWSGSGGRHRRPRPVTRIRGEGPAQQDPREIRPVEKRICARGRTGVVALRGGEWSQEKRAVASVACARSGLSRVCEQAVDKLFLSRGFLWWDRDGVGKR